MNKKLIAYFSRSGDNYVNGSICNLEVGNTEIAAEIIKELTGADMFKIDPQISYSSDYMKCTEEAKRDLNSNARPKLKNNLENLSDYDTVILGFPNYWNTMPMAVWTFLESGDFAGKTILPLCTHEGSEMGISERDIKKLCPQSVLQKGLAIQGGLIKSSKPVIIK